MAKVKDIEKWVELQGQGYKAKNIASKELSFHTYEI